MRLLHTADWHAGRNLRGIDRTPEIVAALEQILEMARDAKVDAILVAGDLFDTQNPSAEAETAVYRFFLEAGQSDTDSFSSTQRVFRGVPVTGGAAFTKDTVYLHGLLSVHTFFRWCPEINVCV